VDVLPASILFRPMGVLDDAIREHLDLKRRHGAAEAELRKQEEEALGPARREVASPESDDGEAAGEAAPEPELSEVIPEEAVQSDAHAEGQPEELPVDEAVPEPPHEEPPPPAPAAVEQEPAGDTPPQGFETVDPTELPDDDELPEDDEVPDVEELDDDELIEEEDGEDSDEDADVLEDTPDFLQETPEHDRLWFEQKPPRDFDFD
jgi:hypothetical protein